jgi:hypothetical protein
MMVKRFLPITIIVAIVFFGTTLVWADDVNIKEIINNPTVTHKNDFSIEVSLEIWNRILDNPYLIGRLWEIYGFQPPYKVTRVNSGLHVTDPTGIIGEIRQVGLSDRSRTFYGIGKFDHWAVPSFFTADCVFIFECKKDRDKLLGEVKIFMQGNNGISRLVMYIFSGTLSSHIDSRFKNNLEDMKKIIRDIANDPDKVREVLTGPLLDDFNAVFPIKERNIY